MSPLISVPSTSPTYFEYRISGTDKPPSQENFIFMDFHAIDPQTSVDHAIATFANDLCVRISAKQPQGASYALSPVSIIAALGMCLDLIKEEEKELFMEKLGLRGGGSWGSACCDRCDTEKPDSSGDIRRWHY
ncbi:MAG: hypothetical protein WCF65_02805 [Parachlamydiaceae bacterium]